MGFEGADDKGHGEDIKRRGMFLAAADWRSLCRVGKSRAKKEGHRIAPGPFEV